MLIRNKKAAMFGVDARIALVVLSIIGLLAVPTFYNLIYKTNAESIISSMKSVDIAIETYIADTGTYPGSIENLYTVAPANVKHSERWNGPYLQGKIEDLFSPSLTWVTKVDNCTSAVTTSRYCDMAVTFTFDDVSSGVYNALLGYYNATSANHLITYTSATSTLTIVYGGASTGNVKYKSYRVKEKA